MFGMNLLAEDCESATPIPNDIGSSLEFDKFAAIASPDRVMPPYALQPRTAARSLSLSQPCWKHFRGFSAGSDPIAESSLGDVYQPQVEILSPQPDEVLQDNTVTCQVSG